MIVVFADDITGAAEIAGVCLQLNVKVEFFVNDLKNSDAEVLVVSSDTRSMTEPQAVSFYESLLTGFDFSEVSVFKKCDSILRGFVLSELLPMIELLKAEKIVLQPANPASGRIIKDGKYYVENSLLNETPFKDDPEFPAFSSDPLALLSQRNPLFFEKSNLTLQLNSPEYSRGVFLNDADSVEDLKTFASQSSELKVGSAAFFGEYLKLEIERGTIKSGLEYRSISKEIENTLILGGSFHPETRKIPRVLGVERAQQFTFPKSLLQEKVLREDLLAFCKDLISKIKEGNVFVGISETKIDFPNSSSVLSKRLVEIADFVLNHSPIHKVFISGGATAWEFMKFKNISRMIPVSQLFPGVIQFYIPDKNLYLTVKPGSYKLVN